MKKRQGSTIILTLIVFVVFSILATGMLSFMVSENNQSLAHKKNVEAYYIARSSAEAAEAAILQLEEEELEELEGKLGEAGNKEVEIGLLDESGKKMRFENDGTIEEVRLKMDHEENLIIVSTGQVDGQTETVEKVLKETSVVGFEYPIYASENLIVGDKDDEDDEKVFIPIEEYKTNNGIQEKINPPELKLGCETFFGHSNYIDKGLVEQNVSLTYPTLDVDKFLEELKETEKIDTKEQFKKAIEGKYTEISASDMKEKIENVTLEENTNYYVEGNLIIKKKNVNIGKNINIFVEGALDIEAEESIKIDGSIYSKKDICIGVKIESDEKKVDLKKGSNITVEIAGDVISEEDICIGAKIESDDGQVMIDNPNIIVKIGGDVISKEDICIGVKIESDEKKVDLKKDLNITVEIGGDVISKEDICIGVKIESDDGQVMIDNPNIIVEIGGDVIAEGEIEIELEIEADKDVKIKNSEINLKVKGNIMSNDDIDIELEIEAGKKVQTNKETKISAKIIGSLYAPKGEIELKIEPKEVDFTLEKGVIIGGNVELEFEDGGTLKIIDYENNNIGEYVEATEGRKLYSPGYYR